MTDETQIQDITYSLAASPNYAEDGICFAARGSGLYRSEDGGNTWQTAYDSLNLTAPLATMVVVTSANFPSDHTVFAGSVGGTLRSFDGGRSWLITTLPSPPPVVSVMAVSPNYSDDGIVLAGTLEDGVFRSANRGSHWNAWNFGLLDLHILCMVISPRFAHDETLLVGTETGVFRSTNGGRAWREVGLPPDYAPVLSLAASPNFADDGIVFAGTESHGLFRSSDGGHTWAHMGGNAINDAVNALIVSHDFGATPDILMALSDSLLLSRDGGDSWSEWKTDADLSPGIAAAIAPQGLAPNAPLLIGLVEGDVLRI